MCVVGRREECGSGCGGVEGECGGEEGECVLWGGGESVCGGEEGRVCVVERGGKCGCVCVVGRREECGDVSAYVWHKKTCCYMYMTHYTHTLTPTHTLPHPYTLHAHPHPHTLHTHPHPPHTTSSHTHTHYLTPTHYQLLVCLSEGACKRYSIALDSWRRNKHSRLLFKSLFSCEV